MKTLLFDPGLKNTPDCRQCRWYGRAYKSCDYPLLVKNIDAGKRYFLANRVRGHDDIGCGLIARWFEPIKNESPKSDMVLSPYQYLALVLAIMVTTVFVNMVFKIFGL